MAKRVNDILRDNIWQFVSVIVGIIAIFVAYDIFFRDREVKALQIVILASSSLVEVEPSIAQDIEISYRNQAVNNLSLIQVKVENIGNQVIRGGDYEQPIKFVFPSESKIVEAAVSESNPPNIGMTVQTEENIATLSPALLNAGDRVILRFLVVDMPSDFNEQPFQIAGGRIAEVKVIPVIEAIREEQVSRPSTSSSLLFSAFYFFGAFLMRFARLSKTPLARKLSVLWTGMPYLYFAMGCLVLGTSLPDLLGWR
jgi:hypothetical protein